jgi:hypothetical protein
MYSISKLGSSRHFSVGFWISRRMALMFYDNDGIRTPLHKTIAQTVSSGVFQFCTNVVRSMFAYCCRPILRFRAFLLLKYVGPCARHYGSSKIIGTPSGTKPEGNCRLLCALYVYIYVARRVVGTVWDTWRRRRVIIIIMWRRRLWHSGWTTAASLLYSCIGTDFIIISVREGEENDVVRKFIIIIIIIIITVVVEKKYILYTCKQLLVTRRV